MLDNKGFDLWANGYDKSVNLSDEENTYPFAGYKEVLNKIYGIVHEKSNGTILDIGFGTGVLTQKLYNDGYIIYGIDFSEKMIEIARSKMPKAILLQQDFSKGLPDIILDKKFDFIICTYAIHHLSNHEKLSFINLLKNLLTQNGKVLIGDIAFETRDEMLSCQYSFRDDWDDDEVYIVFDELRKSFEHRNIEFQKMSFCAGIITVNN